MSSRHMSLLPRAALRRDRENEQTHHLGEQFHHLQGKPVSYESSSTCWTKLLLIQEQFCPIHNSAQSYWTAQSATETTFTTC
jgi:hypothetical protein